MDISFEVRLGRNAADFEEKRAGCGVSLAEDRKDKPTDGLSSFRRRGEIDNLSWCEAGDGGLARLPQSSSP